MTGINEVEFIGNISGDIYSVVRRLRDGTDSRYLRVLLFVHGRNPLENLENVRVVMHGDLAELADGYMQTGARIFVKAHMRQRDIPDKGNLDEQGKPRKKRIVEYVAYRVEFMEGCNFERGQAVRRGLAERGIYPGEDAEPVVLFTTSDITDTAGALVS